MEQVQERRRGSVLAGAVWMIVISILLCWLPGIGGFVAGLVGGRASGGVLPALLAWVLSSVLGTALTGFVVVGALAGLGALALALLDAGMRLLGAILGGLFAP